MKIADMHCDTINRLFFNMKDGRKVSLKTNDKSVDLDKMIKGDYLLQFFACFINTSKSDNPVSDVEGMIDLFHREINNNSEIIGVVRSYEDIENNILKNRMSALLTIEEGAVLGGSIEKLYQYYNKDVRLITLTWNFENELGYPNGSDGGLKKTGFDIVKEMEKMHMIVDVSHLSDKGFMDVANTIKGPFAASHSNARAISSHRRNLTDNMIKILADHGGIMGINYFYKFLNDDDAGISRIDDMINHIKHIKKIGGIDVIGLGSDFDGIDGKLEMEDCSQVPILLERLNAAGFSYDEIDKIAGKNVLRFLKDVL